MGAVLPLSACGDANPFKPQNAARQAAAQGCPRPANLASSGALNAQEREIRRLRKQAFSGDFFSQIELGRRYEAVRSTDSNIADPIEAAVWYATALANSEGYAPISVARKGWGAFRPSGFDDCRAGERRALYNGLDRLLSRMSSTEQEKVRNRVIYVLSTQGPDGYRTLARLHDALYGPFGEPLDNEQAQVAIGGRRPGSAAVSAGHKSAVALFPRNDVDAFLYYYLAAQTGDVSAYVQLKDFERSDPRRSTYGAFVEGKAKRWIPPYEFYPPEAAEGAPHSDESRPRGDDWDRALSKVKEGLPFVHVGRALRYLGVTTGEPTQAGQLTPQEVRAFRGMIGREANDELEGESLGALERVRAVQLAAEQGASQSQLVLAVMYTEGVGVPADYARAFHWFSEAARQGNPEAKYAMSSYFSLGVTGVADQDKAKAVVLNMDAALSGFRPSTQRLQSMLAEVSRNPRDPDSGNRK